MEWRTTTLSRFESSHIQVGDSFVLNASSKKDNPEDTIVVKSARKMAEDIVNNAKAEAAQIMETANLQINNLVQQSEEAINQAKEEGYQSGYKTGYNDGFKQVHTDLINQINSLDTLAEAAFKVKKEIIASSEKEILKLTLVIAEKVLKQKLEVHPEIMLNIVKAAVNELKDKEEVSIIVNPQLTNYLYNFSEELKLTIKGLKSIKILEDRTIHIDGVIVEASEHRIDARLETQISEITKQLMLESEENPVEISEEIEIRIEEPKKRKKND